MKKVKEFFLGKTDEKDPAVAPNENQDAFQRQVTDNPDFNQGGFTDDPNRINRDANYDSNRRDAFAMDGTTNDPKRTVFAESDKDAGVTSTFNKKRSSRRGGAPADERGEVVKEEKKVVIEENPNAGAEPNFDKKRSSRRGGAVAADEQGEVVKEEMVIKEEKRDVEEADEGERYRRHSSGDKKKHHHHHKKEGVDDNGDVIKKEHHHKEERVDDNGDKVHRKEHHRHKEHVDDNGDKVKVNVRVVEERRERGSSSSSEEELPVHEDIRTFLALLQKRDELAGGLSERERQLGETAQNLAEHEKEIIQLYEQERAALLKERELRQQKEEKLCKMELELIEMKKRDKYLRSTLKQKHKELKMEKLMSEERDKELQDLYNKRKRLEEDLHAVRHTQRDLELESSKKQEQIELRKQREVQLQEASAKTRAMEAEIMQISGKYRDLLERYEKEREAKRLEREEHLRKDKELEMARAKTVEVENAQRVAFEKEYARMLETRRRLEEELALARQRFKQLEVDARVKEKETAELGRVREKVKTLSAELENVVGKFGELEVRAERERKKKEVERERRLEREKKLKAMEEKVVESERLNHERLSAERKRYQEAVKIAEQKEYQGILAKEKFHEVAERTEKLQRELKDLGNKSKEYEQMAGRAEQGKLIQRREVVIEKEQDVELEGREQGHKYH